jgi:23S rRNA pseudouridine2605 synthase
MTERLQKYLARAGIASRRSAETLIATGRVKVNGTVVRELGTKVDGTRDLVVVDGKPAVAPNQKSWFLLYKPPGVVTTLSDPQGRPTIKDYLDDVESRVFPVGRLDYDAEGALLLTDDGDIANRLMHPRHQVRRVYLAKVKGDPTDATLEKLKGGVRLEDGPAKPTEVARFERASNNTWLRIVVTEGRPHLIKRLCAAIGHPVVRLYRPSHAGVGVESMRPGQLRPLSSEEVRRVHLVASGKQATEAVLRLPPRRHGRANEALE